MRKKPFVNPGDEHGERHDPVAIGTSLARVATFANDPANRNDSLAGDVRVLLEQAQRLADRTAAAERMRVDLANFRAWNEALHRKIAALRRELDEARRQLPLATTN